MFFNTHWKKISKIFHTFCCRGNGEGKTLVFLKFLMASLIKFNSSFSFSVNPNLTFLDDLNGETEDVRQRNNNRAIGTRPNWARHCYNCCHLKAYWRFGHQCPHLNGGSYLCEQAKFGRGWKKCNYCCEVWRLGKCVSGGCLHDEHCIYYGDKIGLLCRRHSVPWS